MTVLILQGRKRKEKKATDGRAVVGELGWRFLILCYRIKIGRNVKRRQWYRYRTNWFPMTRVKISLVLKKRISTIFFLIFNTLRNRKFRSQHLGHV